VKIPQNVWIAVLQGSAPLCSGCAEHTERDESPTAHGGRGGVTHSTWRKREKSPHSTLRKKQNSPHSTWGKRRSPPQHTELREESPHSTWGKGRSHPQHMGKGRSHPQHMEEKGGVTPQHMGKGEESPTAHGESGGVTQEDRGTTSQRQGRFVVCVMAVRQAVLHLWVLPEPLPSKYEIDQLQWRAPHRPQAAPQTAKASKPRRV
jgi:hypothetical protein